MGKEGIHENTKYVGPIVFACCLSLIGVSRAAAQGYYDESLDDVYIYTDVWDDGPEPGTCDDQTTVYNTFDNVRTSASASYPNTAHAYGQAANIVGTVYPWTREVIHTASKEEGTAA